MSLSTDGRKAMFFRMDKLCPRFAPTVPHFNKRKEQMKKIVSPSGRC